MKRILCIATGLVLVFGVVTSLGADTNKTFDEIDVNSDGFLSTGEAVLETRITTNWPRIDIDENGLVDLSEFSAFESLRLYSPLHDSEEPEPGAAPIQ